MEGKNIYRCEKCIDEPCEIILYDMYSYDDETHEPDITKKHCLLFPKEHANFKRVNK